MYTGLPGNEIVWAPWNWILKEDVDLDGLSEAYGVGHDMKRRMACSLNSFKGYVGEYLGARGMLGVWTVAHILAVHVYTSRYKNLHTYIHTCFFMRT